MFTLEMIAYGRFGAFKANQYLICLVDCPAGFYGPRCNVTCPFPNFGQDCLSICTCLKDQCNYIYGCKIGNIFFNKKKFSFKHFFYIYMYMIFYFKYLRLWPQNTKQISKDIMINLQIQEQGKIFLKTVLNQVCQNVFSILKVVKHFYVGFLPIE